MHTLMTPRLRTSWLRCPASTARREGSCFWQRWMKRRSVAWPCARLTPGAGKMKRIFGSPQHQRKGIGRALAEAIIKEARGLGYRAMRLDTSVRQAEANALYQRLGFQTIKPYYELPEDVRNWLVFMELKL